MKEFADFLGGRPPFDGLDAEDLARLVRRVEVGFTAVGSAVPRERLAEGGTRAPRGAPPSTA